MPIIELTRIITSVLILLIAALQDLKEREVSDFVWTVGILMGGLLDATALLSASPSLQDAIRYFRFSIPFLIIILASWRLKLMGEADILAFITLAILQPFHPLGKCMFPPSFCAMLYSNLFILVVPFSFFAWNFKLLLKGKRIFDGFDEPLARKALASLLAIAIKPEKAESFKYFSIAEKGSPPRKKFKLISALSIPETRDEIPETKEPLIWICPSIPMLPFILAGYLATMLLGDPILILIELIFN